MTADEMFEVLGYKKSEDDYTVEYSKRIIISFHKIDKTVTAGDLYDYYMPAMPFGMKELEAMYAKVKEMRWDKYGNNQRSICKHNQ